MSEILLLYKKLTAAGPADLGEDSLKFSINLGKKDAQMLQELVNRSGLARAQIARMLISSALAEMDVAFNLQNDPSFVFDTEGHMDLELQLAEYEENKALAEFNSEANRIDRLRTYLDSFSAQTPEQKKIVEQMAAEIQQFDKNYNINRGALKGE